MPGDLIRRLQSVGPELVVMGLVAAACGLALAVVLSATLGASSSGPPASLKTVTTPAADLGKVRPAPVQPQRAEAKPHRRAARAAHHAKRRAAAARPAPAVAELHTPITNTQQVYTQPDRTVTAPTNPAPAPVSKPAPTQRRTSSGGGGGGSFDDSG
jgi:hypothetical protein